MPVFDVLLELHMKDSLFQRSCYERCGFHARSIFKNKSAPRASQKTRLLVAGKSKFIHVSWIEKGPVQDHSKVKTLQWCYQSLDGDIVATSSLMIR